MRLIDADEALKRIADKSKKSDNLDVINGLCGATAIIYDMLIESGQEVVDMNEYSKYFRTYPEAMRERFDENGKRH